MTGDTNTEKQTGNIPIEKERQAVRIQQFNSLFNDIEGFNDQFSAGSMMAGMLSKIMPMEDSDKPQEMSLSKIGGEDAQKMTASGINLIHKPLLDAIGLSIEPVSGKTGAIFGLGEKIDIGELRLNIDEKNKFLNFLKNIDDQNANPMLKINLQSLSDILVRQIYDNYDLQAPSDEALRLLGSLSNIVGEYKRLNIEGVDKLEACLNHSKQGDLKEYLAVEQGGLLREPGKSFGPADWQKDATPEYLANRWNIAMKVLDMARENPKAHDLYNRLFSHLQMCLKTAMDNLETLRYWDEERKNELRNVLIEVQQEFG